MREFIFTFFVLSGAIKAVFIPIEKFPDITLISIGLLLIIFLYDAFKRDIILQKLSLSILLLITFYFFLIIIGLFYSPSPTFKYYKLTIYLVNFFTLLYPLTSKNFKHDLFYKYFVWISVFVIIGFLYYYPYVKSMSTNSEIYQNYKGMYLYSSLIAGTALLVTIYIYHSKNKLIKYFFVFLFFSAIIISGARGVLVFLLLIFLFSKFFIEKVNIKINLKAVLVIFLLCIIGLFATIKLLDNPNNLQLIEKRLNRITLLFEDNKGESINSRYDRINFVLNEFKENPAAIFFGFGTASYSIMRNNIDGKDHPHNFLIEAVFDNGILALFVVIIFGIIVFKIGFSNKKQLLLFIPLLFLFLNALKSSSIIELRVLFSFYGVYLVSYINSK